jgi:hypothetical protein
MTTDPSTAEAGLWSAARIFIEQLYCSVLIYSEMRQLYVTDPVFSLWFHRRFFVRWLSNKKGGVS